MAHYINIEHCGSPIETEIGRMGLFEFFLYKNWYLKISRLYDPSMMVGVEHWYHFFADFHIQFFRFSEESEEEGLGVVVIEGALCLTNSTGYWVHPIRIPW